MIAAASIAIGAIAWLFASSELGVVGVLLLLPVVILDVFVALLLVHHYRNAYWLDGRILVRRVIVGRRSYDLSAARISAESAQPVWTTWRGGALPRLVVEAPGRAPARLWLRDPVRGGALLPPDQLAALARAIDPGLRHPVASRLQELASDPLGGIL